MVFFQLLMVEINSFNVTMDPANNLAAISSCTTCTFKQDFSNYWTAVLYFQHQNGSFKRVCAEKYNYYDDWRHSYDRSLKCRDSTWEILTVAWQSITYNQEVGRLPHLRRQISLFLLSDYSNTTTITSGIPHDCGQCHAPQLQQWFSGGHFAKLPVLGCQLRQ